MRSVTKAQKGLALLLILLLTAALPLFAISEAAMQAEAAAEVTLLSMPNFTETDCEWDEKGNLIRETAHTVDGQPALNSRGFYQAEYTWDEHDNLIAEAYYDLDGALVTMDAGYAAAEYVYDVDGQGNSRLLEEHRFMPDGSRASIPGSYSYRVDTWEGDQIVSSEFFDADGKLTRPIGGFAQILYQVERAGDQYTVTKRYLSDDGSALNGSEGGAQIVSVYDEKDRLVSQEIFGVSGAAVLGSGRWHRQENTYDEKDNLVRTDYFDAEGAPILAGTGYASVVNTYDDLSRLIETDYLGVDGKLIKLVGGYAMLTHEYYGGSSLVHYTCYYGADAQRTMTTDGVSKAEFEYDGEDFDYRITYYDIVDQLTMNKDGHARIEWIYEGPSKSEIDILSSCKITGISKLFSSNSLNFILLFADSPNVLFIFLGKPRTIPPIFSSSIIFFNSSIKKE